MQPNSLPSLPEVVLAVFNSLGHPTPLDLSKFKDLSSSLSSPSSESGWKNNKQNKYNN
jgi:hypothetical protein